MFLMGIDEKNNTGPEPLEAFLARYGPIQGPEEWERARKVMPEEVREDINGGVIENLEGFEHYYGHVQGPIEGQKAIPVPFLQWIAYIHPPNAIVMNINPLGLAVVGLDISSMNTLQHNIALTRNSRTLTPAV